MRLILSLFALVIWSQARAAEIKYSCGVGSYKGIFEKVKDGFEKETGINLTVVGDVDKTGTSVIVKNMLAGQAQLGAAPVPWENLTKLMEKDKMATPEQIKSFTHRVIGRDLLQAFTHPDVGVTKPLTYEQLTKAFDGSVSSWKELGGKDVPIKVVLQKKYEATNAFFKSKVMKDKPFATTAKTVESVEDMIAEVQKIPGSIGFVSSLTSVGSASVLKTTEVIGRPITAFIVGKPDTNLEKFFDYVAKNPPK